MISGQVSPRKGTLGQIAGGSALALPLRAKFVLREGTGLAFPLSNSRTDS